MDPGKLIQIITNSTLLATRLLPGAGGPVQFPEARYCVLMTEDAPLAATVAKVQAVHKEGIRVRYRITGGNRDGLFTIDRRSGLITLAAPLDYELHRKHELVVAAEADGKMVHTIVQVNVVDINDNPPQFIDNDLTVTIVEEDDTGLPATILKIVAEDSDLVDQGRLVYSVGGDGVDGYGTRDAYFSIKPHTGELMQLRALDRDPPSGRKIWRVKVQVRDGQRMIPSSSTPSYPMRRHRYSRVPHLGYGYPIPNPLDTLSFEKERQNQIYSESNRQYLLYNSGLDFQRTKLPGDKFDNIHRNREPVTIKQMLKDHERDLSSEKAVQRWKRTRVKRSKVNRNHKHNSSTISEQNIYIHGHDSERVNRKIEVQENYHFEKPSFLIGDKFKPSKIIQNITQRGKIYAPNSAADNLIQTILYRSALELTGTSNSSSKLHSLPVYLEGEGGVKGFDQSSWNSRDPELRQGNSNTSKAVVKRYISTDDSRCQDFSGDTSVPDSETGKFQYPYGSDLAHGNDGVANGYDYGTVEGRKNDQEFWNIHLAETVVTVIVKDINDNAPSFPNATIFGEVQENGPIDLSVAVVSAWDADEEEEGTNALITYSIEKNVIEERSGQAIFAVHPKTGLVRTAICCLDRETTPEYHIQVVAVDGGGLKGTGTVVVRLADVNDNSPRLTQELWQVEVDETWSSDAPDNKTLLEISTMDHDTSNYFFYRVVEASGWGWQHFAMRTHGTIGQLYANRTLDYEDPAQRRGFRFMVQVTDRGRGGWSDSRHTDTAWVAVLLRDLNDNPPEFRRPHVHITVREDTPPGTLLETLPARDPDMSGHQRVKYHVWAAWGAFTVDMSGGVRLWRSLDRESPGGDNVIVKIIGVDEGTPSLSSTATLSITVTDVNDCPPRLLSPTVLHVKEEVPAAKLGTLTATDDDVWALGHGPPFTLSLGPTNPKHIQELLDLRFDPTMDSGRGGAEIWTKGPIDREEYAQLTADVIVADAEGLSTTQPLTVIVDDVNDNRMKPATKTVYLWKMQGGGVDADIGRVYVEDPDDWDVQDKNFTWAGTPHPLFTLDAKTGRIYASAQLKEGRYELHFMVSDRVWGQSNVSANVTVAVRYLSPEALAHAVPITLTPATSSQITSGWTPSQGGGGLGLLSAEVASITSEELQNVEIVSVYGHPSSESVATAASYPGTAHLPQKHLRQDYYPPSDTLKRPFACVWISVRRKTGGYIDPIRLQGLLALHIQQLEHVMKVSVLLEEPFREGKGGPGTPGGSADEGPLLDISGVTDPSLMASTSSRLQVVDTNSTSLVTPRLSRAIDCRGYIQDVDNACTATSCLNGGRCIKTDKGKRCVCPGRTWGRRCKILSRTFKGSGWAWVRPLPLCLPTTLSLRLLTTAPEGLLLYSGPLSSTTPRPRQPPSAMMALQLVNGKPQVALEGARGPMKLEVNTPVNTGDWHTLHLHLDSQGVTLMLDRCSFGWESNRTTEGSHCYARAPWSQPHVSEGWISSLPLQVGGMAHPHPHPHLFGWSSGPVQRAFRGCISHLKINTQLIDLGEPAFSSGSSAMCGLQEAACGKWCGYRGRCTGGLSKPTCTCDPGWTGPKCADSTTPVTLSRSSFIRLTINFAPDPYAVVAQLRVKTQGRSHGLLMQVMGRNATNLQVRIRGGVACATVTRPGEENEEACVEDYFLGDGSWHTVYVGRQGHDLSIAVDDGDGWHHNDTLVSSLRNQQRTTTMFEVELAPPVPFLTTDGNHTLFVGGLPEDQDSNLVRHDLIDSCIDDIRISGKPLPLHPSTNDTEWGRVAASRRVEGGCASHDLCANTSCVPPLACHQTWRQTMCSCGPGSQLQEGLCQDIDECAYQPCLHGGTCTNLIPGYQCSCNRGISGYNCEWHDLPTQSQQLTPPMAIAALTLSLLILVLICVILTIWIHRSRNGRCGDFRRAGDESETHSGSVMGVVETPLSVQDVHTTASKEDIAILDTLKIRMASTTSLEDKKTSISSISCSKPPDDPMKDICMGVPFSSVKSASRTRGNLLESGSTTSLSSKSPKVVAPSGRTSYLAKDDLRAYAYEGDGSSSGSLTSTVLGLRRESLEESSVRPLVPECREALDLLKTLPDGVGSPVAHSQQGLRSRVDQSESSLCCRSVPITSQEKEYHIAPNLTGSEQCRRESCGGGNSGGSVRYVGEKLSSFATLPHSVTHVKMERKSSMEEFSKKSFC